MQDANTEFTRRQLIGAVAAATTTYVSTQFRARAQTAPHTRAQKEEFLLKAKVVKTQAASKGVTQTIRATLDDGKLIHEASIQTIDEYRTSFQTPMGVEMNFKDSWKFNVAAYKLDQMLGLNMVPVTVERKHGGKTGSFTWWVDDFAMDEVDRTRKKIEPPDPDNWNKQMQMVRVFDQLIYNVDRNLQNLVVDKDWQIWMIDHSRTFRMLLTLREAKNLERCDQGLLEKLKQLNAENLKQELGNYLQGSEIRGLLARRDKIVKIFEERGPSALYTCPRRVD